MSVAVITGSGGLIGSEAAIDFGGLGLDVVSGSRTRRPISRRPKPGPVESTGAVATARSRGVGDVAACTTETFRASDPPRRGLWRRGLLVPGDGAPPGHDRGHPLVAARTVHV